MTLGDPERMELFVLEGHKSSWVLRRAKDVQKRKERLFPIEQERIYTLNVSICSINLELLPEIKVNKHGGASTEFFTCGHYFLCYENLSFAPNCHHQTLPTPKSQVQQHSYPHP